MANEVITFGCRLNIYETEIIKQNLSASNLDNVAVFNTCSVTEKAKNDAIRAIRKYKKNHPNMKIVVTGCASQIEPDLFGQMPEIDKILGNNEKLNASYYDDFDSVDRVIVNDIMSVRDTASHLVASFSDKARAFIQVQNGCNHRCTFCIIPYARGNSRSVPLGLIVEQSNLLLDEGYKEIVLTGVDVTDYGLDLPGQPTFAQMIRRLLNLVPRLQRLRLSSIDVAEVDQELLDLMVCEKRLMPHFHISLQSGDDMILKRMKRRHNRKQVIDFCNFVRNKRSDVAFGADIIAGFPTENEVMFENTIALVKDADIQYLHVFPYSIKSGTPASRMPQVANDIKKSRAFILRSLGEQQVQKFFKRNLGRIAELLVEKNNTAHTENFIPVKLQETFEYGALVQAQLSGIEQNYMTVTY